ncbi:DUF427 domain-containing protein [Mesorhizobium sp. SP-1A]|uniref:DUF427 domain-containing protein n=1 Tax=Mesorhizobium sp. SP-1A TaxID=3077840 RepID=UPI0028F6C2E4|nr:DUF427 domain-containing protein [Mesorhizobium sp. SP-1A]
MQPASETPADTRISIEPFSGVVTVRFSDAIIAPSKRAWIMRQAGSEPVLYVPFEDIYFEFLKKTDKVTRSAIGTASYWRVQAVNASSDDFMMAYETPEPWAAAIARHGCFDPAAAQIDVDPEAA